MTSEGLKLAEVLRKRKVDTAISPEAVNHHRGTEETPEEIEGRANYHARKLENTYSCTVFTYVDDRGIIKVMALPAQTADEEAIHRGLRELEMRVMEGYRGDDSE